MIFRYSAILAFMVTFLTTAAFADHTANRVTSVKAAAAPTLDGRCSEDVWATAAQSNIYDKTAGSILFLKSVYTNDELFFCVRYPDTAENSLHKAWIWNANLNSYMEGPHREDTFIFKWSMMERPVDLSNFSDDDYSADVWYWKANRTNPAGYADDKIQTLTGTPFPDAMMTTSISGKNRYLYRKADMGKPAYREIKDSPDSYSSPIVNRFEIGTPNYSRGDIRAKGSWSKGFWTIEFGRKLDTNHNDDVQFDLKSNRHYLFGVSIFSLYGRPLVMDQPNRYGMGRISDPIELVFEK